ncbi:hypothetical protein TCE0_033f09301 [Talaromyces pinophilus]|uniref:BZIP domain-containing protein n=1 Tax=Talaromyces pinophilus TaxID=128442 RepID=A0A6V8HAR5_TALPI|nr:hypothetical protein TCE0_033f09301 [Talaromyces pinophilus]
MPTQTRSVENVTKEKRKQPVRRDPEKRRQQNIQAQRKYRAKLRQRLDQLEAFAATAVSCDAGTPDTAVAINTSSTQTRPEDLKAYNYGASITHIATSQECFHPDVRLEERPFVLGLGSSVPQLDDVSLTSGIWDFVIDGPDQSTSLLNTLDDAKTTCSDPSTWDTTITVDPRLLIRVKHNHDASHNSRWTTAINCSCSNPHFQVQTQGPDPFSFDEIRVLRFKTSPSPPLNDTATALMMTADPYKNNLRLDTICTLSALVDLGMHVGLTEEIICADESLSPFYRFSITDYSVNGDTLRNDLMINTVQQIFRTLKPDLRPNREQITIKHHPQIDILPFPTLRKNFILQQDRIDEDEFFQDVLAGLVCWGGAGPTSRKDREENTGHISSGTPWDGRSWEAKDWFLRKYWGLLGGEEGELVRQSEWWRGIRGDDPLNIESFG